MDKGYIDTVRLLLDATPDVFRSGLFAMKGGTAINLFVQNLPRLSVDIDVVYVAHATARTAALKAIAAELNAIRDRFKQRALRPKSPQVLSATKPRSSSGADASR